MTNMLKSLEQISTNYSVFEKDQVLTHDQLNSLGRYFDDQTRLTRISLLGVGLVCGLEASLQGNTVTVTKGVGVTTDGDLVFLGTDRIFDQFKAYDESNPIYAPFRVEGTLIPVFELVAQGATDARAASLTQFRTQTGQNLDRMVVVLLMESYEKDEDLCSGTDCDNLGKDCINTIKVLLVEKSSVGLLRQPIGTAGQAVQTLNPIVADRPLLSSAIQSFAQLAQVYRVACTAIHRQLVPELQKLYPSCAAFLKDVFPSDPGPAWVSRLNALNGTTFGPNNHAGIQYYYDFLKDVVETYNAFRDCVFGDATLCCPDPDRFPKHLLLGNLVPGSDPEENRTGFYPSPAISRSAESVRHAKFLAGKLDAMIQTFRFTSSANNPIRITPSHGEDHPLEERAIPYYYQGSADQPIHSKWNHALSRRGMDRHNYSYHAGSYGGQGGAANPLRTQLGRYGFFRIEGHVGQNITAAVTSLETQIQQHNLPIAVRAMMLGNDRTRIVIKPGIRYSDLHRFHYVLRQDLSHQLDEVSRFSGTFKQQVDSAVSAKIVTDSPEDNDGVAVRDLAAEKHGTVTAKSGLAKTKVARSYSAYRTDMSWKADLSDTIKAAGEFKANLSKVAHTAFTTPFDSLIANTHVHWLDWLDTVIKEKEDKEDDKLLFGNFVKQHPGLEHFGGVARGGTFILVYDTSNTVLADFMLPYYCCEAVEAEPEEPALPKPPVRPPFVVDGGLVVGPSREKFVKDKLSIFQTDLTKTLQPKFDLQKDYVQDTVKILSTAFGKAGGVTAEGGAPTKFQDPILGLKVQEMETKQKELEAWKAKASEPGISAATKRQYDVQAQEVELALAKSIESTTKYMSDSNVDVTVGTEGHTALLGVSKGMGALSQTEAVTSAKTGLNSVMTTTKNTNLKLGLTTLLK